MSLSLSLLGQVSVPLICSAQGVRPGSIPLSQSNNSGSTTVPSNLDLSSTTASMGAQNTKPVNIQVGGNSLNGTISGGTSLTVLPGQLLTPAQYLATLAAINGHQTLLLNNSGAAIGGSAILNAKTSPALNGLLVPTNVSINAIGFNKATPLNVSGVVDIFGSVYALQNTQNVVASMNLGSLVVEQGGLLSTRLPAGFNLPGVFSSAGLQINTSGNVLNHGTIFSGGNLAISAGGAITNQTLGNLQAQISAINLSLNTAQGSIINSGLIQASQSMELSAALGKDLFIDNKNGLIEATGLVNAVTKLVSEGTINIGNIQAPELANVRIIGGQISSVAGTSIYGKNMDVSVDRVDGVINNTGSTAHLDVSGGNLLIGTQNLSGDPTYFNSNGDITLTDTISVAGDLAFVASGNILTTGKTSIQTTAANNSILMSAGYQFTTDGPASGTDSTTTITFNGSADSSKNISSPGNELNIKTSGTGTITLISAGKVDLGTGVISSQSGKINILGAGGVTTKGSISSTAGNISIASGDVGNINLISIKDGTPSALPSLGTLSSFPVQVSDISIGNGQTLDLSTAAQLTIGKVTSNTSNLNFTGSAVTITGNVGSLTDTTTITSTAGDITVLYDPSPGLLSSKQLVLNSAGSINGVNNDSLAFLADVADSIDASAAKSVFISNSHTLGTLSVKAKAGTGFINLNSSNSIKLLSDLDAQGVTLRASNFANAQIDLNGHLLKSNGKDISLVASDIVFNSGTINAGAGNVFVISAQPDLPISLGSATGGLHFSQADLKAITANKLRIGFGMNGGMTIGNGDGTGGALVFPYSVDLYQFDDPDIPTAVGNINSGAIGIEVSGNLYAQSQAGDISVGKITSTTNGNVTLVTSGGDINLSGTNGASLPVAHEIKLLAGGIGVGSATGALTGLGSAALLITPVVVGNDAGSVYLRGNNLGTTGNVGTTAAPLTIDVSAPGSTGNGGVASFERTATGAFAPTSASLLLKVSGGSTSGNQGTAVISNNGDLTYNTSAANKSIEYGSGSGNGVSTTLSAGNISKGNLLVTGPLDTSANGSDHDGGNITLESNSTTPLAIAMSNTKNGITGLLTLNKTGIGKDGALTIVNRGGNISNTVQNLTAVSKLVFDTSSAATGSITNTKLLGSSSTSEIRISTKGGAINSTAVTLTTQSTGSVYLQTASGAITANIDTGNVSVNTGGSAAATINSIGSNPLNVLSSSVGGSLTITQAGGDLNVTEPIFSGNTLTLKTSKTDAVINVNANLTAGFQFVGFGTMNLQTAGNGSISGTGTLNAKTINLTSGTGSFGTALQALNLTTAQVSLNSSGLVNINNGAYNLDALKISSAKSANNFTLISSNSIVLAAALTNVSKATLQSTNGSLTLSSGIGNSTSTDNITLTAKGSITGAGLLTNSTGKTIALTVQSTTATIGSSSVPINVSGSFITISNSPTAAGLINLNSKNTGSSTISGLVTTGSVKLATAGAANFGSNVSGSSVTLNLKDDNNFLGSIAASNGALTLTQTGAGFDTVDVAFALSATSSITIKVAGALAVHDTINSGASLTVTSGGAVNLGLASKSITTTGPISITQTATDVNGSSFGSLSGQSVTVKLKPLSSAVQFLGSITATNGSILISETGLATNTSIASTAKATGDITITSVGPGSFGDITAGDKAGNGAINLTLGDASSLGALSTSGTKGNITIVEKFGKLSFPSATASAAISITNQFVDGIEVSGALAANSKVTIASNGFVSVGGKTSASSKTGLISIAAPGNQYVSLAAVDAPTVTISAGNIGADTLASTPTLLNSASLTFKSLGSVNFNNSGTSLLTIAAASTATNSATVSSQGAISILSPLKTTQSIELSSNSDMLIKATTVGGSSTNKISISANTLTGAGVLKANETSGVIDLKVAANIGTSTSSLKVNAKTVNIANATSVVNVFNQLASTKSTFNVSTTSSPNLILGSAGASTYSDLTAGSITIKYSGASDFNKLTSSIGAISLTQSGAASKSSFNGIISSAKSVSITTTGDATYGSNITASDGSIVLSANTGVLQVSNNVSINSNGTGSQITLMEKANTNTSGIVIGSLVSLSTLASSKTGTKLPLPGQINIIIGTSVPTAPVQNPTGQPANTIIDIQPPTTSINKVYWGTNSGKIDSSGASGAGNEIKLSVIGNSAIVFSAGTKAGITIGAKTTLTADPPSNINAVPALRSFPSAVPVAQAFATRSSQIAALGQSNIAPLSHQNSKADADITSFYQSLPLPGAANITSLAAVNSATRSLSSTPPLTSSKSAFTNSASAFPLHGTVNKQERLGSNKTHTEFEHRLQTSSGYDYTHTLENGGRLIAPTSDMVLKTNLADIDIAAKSLVLIYCNDSTLVVFNIDDHHKNAVRVKFNKHCIDVPAGSQLLLSDKVEESFEKLNVVKRASYRKIIEKRSDDLKFISAEFSVPSLLTAISKIRGLLNSNNAFETKIGKHLLKTAAALNSVRKDNSAFRMLND